MRKLDVAFKGTKEGVLIILDDSQEFNVIKDRLREKLQAADDFFLGAEVILDIGNRELTREEFMELVGIITEEHQLILLKVITQSAEGAQGDENNGSNVAALFEEIRKTRPADKETNEHGRQAQRKRHESQYPPTLIVRRTLRSGQQINYDGNVVVIGDVNPGAEIIASGDIIIMGSFRGVAHAGAKGNEKAIVAAFRLQPTQLRIANYITRCPDEEMPEPVVPELAQIRDNLIVIESYLPQNDRYMQTKIS